MKAHDENCTICKKKRKLVDVDKERICATCQKCVDLLKARPEAIRHLAKLAGGPVGAHFQSRQKEQDLPEVLDGVRYRTIDRERNKWYVSVSEVDGNPVEIFASTAFDRDQHLQSRISNLTTITRLISLILRHVFMGEHLTLEKTLTQLKRSSRQPNDLPDMLGKVLANYSKKAAALSDQETMIP
ncbi:MAG: TSCPD domain-containing protein [Desulforhopalus sp.]